MYAAALPFLTLCLSQPRFLMVLTLPVPPPEGVYVNSEGYAALGRYSQRRTCFHLTF